MFAPPSSSYAAFRDPLQPPQGGCQSALRSASLGVGRLADAGALERRRRFADDGLSTGADRLPLCCLSGAGGSNARTIDWRSVIQSSAGRHLWDIHEALAQ